MTVKRMGEQTNSRKRRNGNAHVADAIVVLPVVVERNDNFDAKPRRLRQNVVDAAEDVLVKDTCTATH